MNQLRAYLNSLPCDEQIRFAERAGTTLGSLRTALSKDSKIGESTCIRLEKESKGAIRLEDLRPDVDWGYCANRYPAATLQAA